MKSLQREREGGITVKGFDLQSTRKRKRSVGETNVYYHSTLRYIALHCIALYRRIDSSEHSPFHHGVSIPHNASRAMCIRVHVLSALLLRDTAALEAMTGPSLRTFFMVQLYLFLLPPC
jgi:hypothetical protein